MTVRVIDKGWEKIKKELAQLEGAFVQVGIMSNSPEYNKTGDANLADVATWNEYGTTTGIHARPFMAKSLDKNLSDLQIFAKKQIDQIYQGTQNHAIALEKLGLRHKSQVQSTIENGQFKPNAPATIRAKGSSKPLIDTGRLKNGITYEVKK